MRASRNSGASARRANKGIFYRACRLASAGVPRAEPALATFQPGELKESLPNHPCRFMRTYTSDSVIRLFVANAGGEIEKDKCATRNRTTRTRGRNRPVRENTARRARVCARNEFAPEWIYFVCTENTARETSPRAPILHRDAESSGSFDLRRRVNFFNPKERTTRGE